MNIIFECQDAGGPSSSIEYNEFEYNNKFHGVNELSESGKSSESNEPEYGKSIDFSEPN